MKIFEDAATEPQIILIRNQEKNNDFEYLPVKLTQDFVERKLTPILIHKQNLQDSEWVFADDAVNNILENYRKIRFLWINIPREELNLSSKRV